MNVIINYTRLTTSDRLADRFLTCQVYNPHDEDSVSKGSIYSHVEILNPWFAASQVGQSIINTLIREYYKADDTSDLNNFETAIKEVNESLAQIAQSGETDWIGRLSSVLVLINGLEAHFAQTGQSHAYLYRGNQINHITEGLENEVSPHPLKTFTNLTSGTLQEGDKIVVANSTFFEIIDPSELKIIATQNNPTQAAIEAGKILKGRGIKHANAVFIEVTTKEALANLTPDQKRDVVYINEQLSSLTSNLRNIWTNLLVPLMVSSKTYFHKVLSETKKKLSPKLKRGLSHTAESSKKLVKLAKEKSFGVAKEIKEKNSKTDDGQKINSKNKLSDSVRLLSLKTKNKLKRLLISIGFTKPHRPRMYLIGLIITITILVIAIGISSFSKNKKLQNQEMQDKLNRIISLEGETSVLVTQNNDEQALINYKEIMNLSEELKDSKYSEQASKSYDTAFSKILEITSAQELSNFEEKELPIKPQLFGIASNYLYLISDKYELYNLQTNKIINIQDKIDGEVSHLTTTGENLVLSTKNNSLYTIKPNTEEITEHPIKLNYDGPIKSFIENIYVLDPPSNQIWKIVNDDGYKESLPYLADEDLSIADAVSLAIDGNIYTLSQSCNIERLSRGRSISSFTINLPANEKVANCSDIYTSEDTDNLYILAEDNNFTRIIELRKNGTFISQYIIKNMHCDSNCFIDIEKRIFYKAEDSKLKSARF